MNKLVSFWVNAHSKSWLYLSLCLFTTVNWHTTPPSVSSSFSWGVTDCRSTWTGLREIVGFCFFPFLLSFFTLLKHMLSHKAGILSFNCSTCHTSACQETVGGHLWSCGCKCIYKCLCAMCHNLPLCLAELKNNYSSKILLVMKFFLNHRKHFTVSYFTGSCAW